MAKTKTASAALLKKGDKAAGKNDVLAEVAKEVENLSQKQAFALVGELVQSSGLNEFRLGGVLAAIQDKAASEGGEAWLDGLPSFKELVDEKFGLHYRKAMYLISIYKNLVEKQIPWSAVKGIGWTKLKELAPILTAKNAESWAAKAAKLTVLQLIEAVKKAEQKGSDAGESSTSSVTTLTFKLHEDQKATVRQALNKAKKESGTEFDSQALMLVSTSYLGNATAEAPKADEKLPKTKKAQKAMLVALMKATGPEDALRAFEEAYPKWEITANSPD